MKPDLDTRLNAQELARQLSEKRVSVIDVREAMEFAGGHIEGSVNVPLRRLNNAPLPLMRQVQIAAGSLVLLGLGLGSWVAPACLVADHAVPRGFGLNALIPRAVTRDQQPSATGSLAAAVWCQMHALIRSC
jgi:rhodanese-related sulfurtransferase